MGTNFYLVRREPTIRESIHVCKRSAGWETLWQATDSAGYPRWCDGDPTLDADGLFRSERELPHEIASVDDIRKYLQSGDWILMDEYGNYHADWETVIASLESWHGGDPDRKPREHSMSGTYRDKDGNMFFVESFE